MPRRYEDGPAQLGAIALLYQQHGFKGAKLMVVSVDQRILCVNNVETVFLGVTIKVQDEILERDVGGRIPVHRITEANQRVAVSSGVSSLIDVPNHRTEERRLGTGSDSP